MSDISSSHAVTRMMAPSVMAQEGLDRAARPRQGSEQGKQSDKPRGDVLSFSAAASSVLAGANDSDPLTQNVVQAPNQDADVSPDPADKGVTPPARKDSGSLTSAGEGERDSDAREPEQEGTTPPETTAPGFPTSPAEAAADKIGRTYEERSAEEEAAPGGDKPQPKPLPAPEAAAAKMTSTRAERREVDKFSPCTYGDTKECTAPPRAPAPSPAGRVIDLQS